MCSLFCYYFFVTSELLPFFLFYPYRVPAQSEHIIFYAYCTGYCLLFVVLLGLPLLQHVIVESTRTKKELCGVAAAVTVSA